MTGDNLRNHIRSTTRVPSPRAEESRQTMYDADTDKPTRTTQKTTRASAQTALKTPRAEEGVRKKGVAGFLQNTRCSENVWGRLTFGSRCRIDRANV